MPRAIFPKDMLILSSTFCLSTSPTTAIVIFSGTYAVLKNFIRSGAGLDPEKQDRLRKLNSQIDMLQLTFGQNLLAETNRRFEAALNGRISQFSMRK